MMNQKLISIQSTLAITWTIFFLTIIFFWIYRNNIPPEWDQALTLEGVHYIYNPLAKGDFQTAWENFLSVTPRKAPLIVYSIIPLYFLADPSFKVALLVNFLYAILFFWSFYQMVKIFYGSTTALLSLIIVSTMPVFYGLIRTVFVEFGLMSLVTAFTLFAYKYSQQQRDKYLILLGLISGLGILMKFHFFIFIVGQSLLLIWSLHQKQKFSFINLRNIILFSIPALLITLPWYSKNILVVLWHIKRSTNPEHISYSKPIYYPENFFNFSVDIINHLTSSYYFLLVLVLLIILKLTHKRLGLNLWLLTWFIFPFLIIFTNPNQEYRYMLPLIPPIAVFIGWLFSQLKSHLKYLLLVFPILLFVNSSATPILYTPQKYLLGPFLLWGTRVGHLVYLPDSTYWPSEQIVLFLNSLPNGTYPKKIVSASEHPFVNINTLRYFQIKNELPIQFSTISYIDKGTPNHQVESLVFKSDYLIIKTKELLPINDYFINSQGMAISRITPPSGFDIYSWEEITHPFTFPDGSKLLIFKVPK